MYERSQVQSQQGEESDGRDSCMVTFGLRTIEESRPSDFSPCCDYACDLSYITSHHVSLHVSVLPFWGKPPAESAEHLAGALR